MANTILKQVIICNVLWKYLFTTSLLWHLLSFQCVAAYAYQFFNLLKVRDSYISFLLSLTQRLQDRLTLSRSVLFSENSQKWQNLPNLSFSLKAQLSWGSAALQGLLQPLFLTPLECDTLLSRLPKKALVAGLSYSPGSWTISLGTTLHSWFSWRLVASQHHSIPVLLASCLRKWPSILPQYLQVAIEKMPAVQEDPQASLARENSIWV